MPQQWSYLIVDLDDDKPIEEMNAYGQLFWELVSVTTHKGKQRAYFRRPRSESISGVYRAGHSQR